ncbi:MAG: ABC-ATPase domain-containing protein [Arcanobacterium sp.]|nr:ABC-ATPase domain-containing protein [Arcanobacterium sp.]
MRSSQDLARLLTSIDGSGYSSYRQIVGNYELTDSRFPTPPVLIIDRTQVDPYAPPSRVRLFIPAQASRFPQQLINDRLGRIAVGDFLTRAFEHAARSSRDIRIAHPGQEILERTSVIVDDEGVEARFTVRLPAAGRRIRGREARSIFLDDLPDIAAHSLIYSAIDAGQLERQVNYMRDRSALLNAMHRNNTVAFIANGSILPRESGDSDKPLTRGAMPFEAPSQLRWEYESAHNGALQGMAIPAGITVIVGGGFHGKSTLLRAIQRGVYPHVFGDGREWAVTVDDAVAVRAEDGRSVANTDISPFINSLPSGKPTDSFSTTNASGSTSQAANVMEALEAGARVLIIDEDTSATNFMIRDAVMRELIPTGDEPITPLIDRIVELRDTHGISTIIVAGGSSAFLKVADTVISMKSYEPQDVTQQAHALVRRHAEGGTSTDVEAVRRDAFYAALHHPRIIVPASMRPHDKKRPAKAAGLTEIRFGQASVDLSALEQLVDPAQTAAIAEALECIASEADGKSTMRELVDEILRWIDDGGLDALAARGHYPGTLARPRRHEIMATLNRMRSIEIA